MCVLGVAEDEIWLRRAVTTGVEHGVVDRAVVRPRSRGRRICDADDDDDEEEEEEEEEEGEIDREEEAKNGISTTERTASPQVRVTAAETPLPIKLLLLRTMGMLKADRINSPEIINEAVSPKLKRMAASGLGFVDSSFVSKAVVRGMRDREQGVKPDATPKGNSVEGDNKGNSVEITHILLDLVKACDFSDESRLKEVVVATAKKRNIVTMKTTLKLKRF